MTAEEVEDYINHRLEVAGATTKIFTKGACESIHLVSKGTPRLINQICDYALVYAYSYERKEVDAATIQQVIMDRKIYGVFNTTSQGQTPFNTANTLGDEPEPLEPPIDLQERAHKNRT